MEKDEKETNSREAGKISPLKADVAVLGHVNLALMQNGLAALRNLRIENTGDEPLRDVVCAFSSEGGFIVPWRLEFGEIKPGEAVERGEVEILLNQRRILDVATEPVAGEIRMVVTAAASCGDVVCERRYPMTILAPNQWPGLEPYPQLLAAYVLGDDDFVARLQSDAAAEIENATGRSSLEGYRSGKKRVVEIAAAVAAAIGRLRLRIDDSPVDLAQPCMRVRVPGDISRERVCTRLEESLLVAAILEKCELHPVLIVLKDTCLVACHLVDTLFEDVVVRKAQTIRKRIELDELAIVGGDAEIGDDSFVCAIDIVRSRETGVAGALAGWAASSGRNSAAAEQRVQTRIERWTQKLLDFSARNRLLNIPRTSRQVMRLMCADVADLEDRIAANKKISIRSIAEAMGDRALDDLLAGRISPDSCRDVVRGELDKHRLCAMMPQREVARRLSDIMHDARTDLEESGVNTLFLTIGELQWMEAGVGANRKSYRAPILMVPVRLERASMSEGVRMYRLDEDTTVNTTLLEFLRSQFGISMPGLDPLPLDEYGVDVHQVLQIFRQGVEGLHGWEVVEDATLGCFSFGKFVMWKDMTERADELRRNPLVNHLIGGGGNFEDGVDVFPAAEVARHIVPGELFCPLSCDSSQLTAVLYSERGKTFVLHGPPGTGKSQTIANIIAHNLAKGRRVLFVSEKKAALDVVKDRLDRIGLTPFCLELHSNKTGKGRFYEQIKAALDVPETDAPAEWDRVAADILKCRAELDGYVQALHRQYPNGLTAYDCFSSAMQNGGRKYDGLIGIDCLAQDREGFRDSRQAVKDLLDDFRNVSEEALSAIPRLKADAWSPALERGLLAAAETLCAASRELRDALSDAANLPPSCLLPRAESGEAGAMTAFDHIQALASVLDTVKDSGKVGKFLFDAPAGCAPGQLLELAGLHDRYAALAGELSAYRLDRLPELDFDGIAARLDENAKKFAVVRFFKNLALAKELSGIVKTGAPKLTAERLSGDLPKMRELVAVECRFSDKSACGIDECTDVGDAFRSAASSAVAKWKAFAAAFAAFAEFADEELRSRPLEEIGAICRATAENVSELRNAMRYRQAAKRAESLGVGAFAAYIAENDDGNLDVLRVFDEAYRATMLASILETVPELAGFSGLGHDERIARFRELDAQCTGLARKAVFARLAASLPRRRSGPCPDGSELGMIKRECEKKMRQKAVRQILAESKTLIPALKPCFLMSPLSVAQYLPVDSAPFDLVVFDEASQIPVWDAIGVIARGKQLIVVGDPKQMPPTNFFRKGDADDEDAEEEVIADQESILDECLVAGVFSTYLNWHYRSRHESLIAFSNEHYYSGKLCTFPAATSSPRLGVKFMFVKDGRFVKTGRGPSVNETEARALVDYVCESVRSPGYVRRSIGIVTFSMPQQKLIRSLLEERIAADPVLERFLPEEGEGAYFVKNLENVQGDESDVILFSIGYAPDENDRFTMNFGPLNLAGGERRLNVAVTRAKEQVVVFSSIHASQIDAGEDGRTKAVGAGHLKAFLQYAEREGSMSKGQASRDEGEASRVEEQEPRGAFGDFVAGFLTEKGYKVDRDVGCSEYRIDVAVRDPNDAARYIAGIECDGPAYARQRTVQDRDVNRIGVLRGLGWRMFRVWSVDWTLDRTRAEQRLIDEISASPANAAAIPVQQVAQTAQPTQAALTPQQTAKPSRASAYMVWKTNAKLDHSAFYEPKSRQKISKMMAAAIETEGPIYETTLRKRIAKAWGLSRITENIQRVFDACMPSGYSMTEHETGKVIWPKDETPANYRLFRLPSASDPASKRTLDEIPPEELGNAMRQTIEDLGSCQEDDLYREVIKLFGLSSLTSRARRFLDVGKFESLKV